MTSDKRECDLMSERLAAYLDGDLAPDERAAAEEHLAFCNACAGVLAELRTNAADAARLPLLMPTRDLWAGVESRIRTHGAALGTAPRGRAPRRMRPPIAIAAGALIALASGTTYLLTARSAGTVAPVPLQTATLISHSKKDLGAAHVYDREISLLDSLVRTRREELDPRTVAVIERNLAIIDSAIAESRAALEKDPKSPLLTNRLDDVLGSKVELLRTVAFLPSRS